MSDSDVRATVNAVHSILQRLAVIVMFVAFGVFHVGALTIFLLAMWFFELRPTNIAAAMTAFGAGQPGHTLLAIYGVLGLSLLGILYVYVRLWRRLYTYIAVKYLLRFVDKFYQPHR